MEKSSVLRSCVLFSGLSAPELAEIASACTVKQMKRSQLIFSEGDPARGFYVVASGKVKLYKLSSDGKEQILHVISAGEAFGEAAAFRRGVYPAYSEALRDGELLYFSLEGFLKRLEASPQLALNMIGTLSEMLHRFTQMVEDLSLKEVSARVAKYLLDLVASSGVPVAERAVVTLDVSKTQLAARLGTTSETMSRTLRKLRDKGIVEVRGKTVLIRKRDVLESVSAGLKL